jgi:hypothetical protein
MNPPIDNAENRARQKLKAAGVFFYDDPSSLDDDDDPELLQTLNMNDTWAWACADAEYVPDEELPEVSRLFFCYGWCGILYWVSERNGHESSEFHDINRFIEFVRNEEAIRTEVPGESARAYAKRQYTIGVK